MMRPEHMADDYERLARLWYEEADLALSEERRDYCLREAASAERSAADILAATYELAL